LHVNVVILIITPHEDFLLLAETGLQVKYAMGA